MVTMNVRKAVIPVAGLGTRFLPATRSVPKVMFPVLDTPVVQFAVEEAVEAGIKHIVFVISERQEAVSVYFTRNPDLEEALKQRGDEALLRRMLAVSQMAEFSYVRQRRRLGLGDAILTAQGTVGDEPFAVLLPDDIIWADSPTLGGLIELFGRYGGLVIAVKEVPDEAVPSLGIIEARSAGEDVFEVVSMVEKPALSDAPSNLAIIGRYVLPPQVFEAVEKTPPGAGGEVQLTDALSLLLSKHGAHAYRFPGDHFDAGTPLGLLKASAFHALQQKETAAEFRRWLDAMLQAPPS